MPPENVFKISRLMEHLNPRYARVAALPKPSDRDNGERFFRRYVRHLTTAREIVFLDRPRYNHAGVGWVMGL
jgi:polyphosphate kinase 2 (PPK2 family)